MCGKKIKMKEEVYKYKWYLFGCKDAGYLHEKKHDIGLTLSEIILYHFHMLTCNMCRRYIKQLRIIQSKINILFQEIYMNAETKEKIQKVIEKKFH